MNIALIIGILAVITVVVWLAYEFITAPTLPDEHDECVKAREDKPE